MSKKVISATVTPLREDGSLDKTGLKNIPEAFRPFPDKQERAAETE